MLEDLTNHLPEPLEAGIGKLARLSRAPMVLGVTSTAGVARTAEALSAARMAEYFIFKNEILVS